MNKNENTFMFYPEIRDKDFNEKIYLKKEFRDTEITKRIDWNKVDKPVDFVLEPYQSFLKNYISPDTPYNGILIFHGTGVGKTCTAIQIAEGFKSTLKNLNKKILILTNLRENFNNELFDFKKERLKESIEYTVQCTGKEYELGENSLYLTQEQKEKEISKIIKSYYQFFRYRKFANYIIDKTKDSTNPDGWKGDENKVTEKIKKFISKEFDNRVIIIDEIQNIKTEKKEDFSKNIQRILQSIIKFGKNIKLVLMSATPMFDRPDEIIFYINLLLLNDGRPLINKSDIFNSKDGLLKEGSEELLKKVFKGYVSYVRAEKPFIFPFRIYPKEAVVPKDEYYMSGAKIDANKQIQFTKLILCPMESVQSNTYLYFLSKKIKQNLDNIDLVNVDINDIENNKKNIGYSYLFDLTKISNIVYPIKNENIGSFSKSSYESDNGTGGYYKSINTIGTKRKIQFKYQSHAIFDKGSDKETPFADEKYLNNYSSKFSSILQTIKKSKGIVFVYSQYIEQGVLPFALMLEQNGYIRDCIEGEDQLLDYTANKKRGGGKRKPICVICNHDATNKEHSDEKLPNYHVFRTAKYILCYGDTKDIVRITPKNAVAKFSNIKNKYGEEIKIFVGTSVISEGYNFKNIRQVHIIEPWYNLSRIEQIIGRAIRYESHKALLPEERNVEIYQYSSTISDKNYSLRETVDIKNYRIAENKDKIIKTISRIMKESAVDCVLFRNANIIDSDKKVKQITSSGEVLEVSIADKPYSALCDYNKNCNYYCNWMPNPNKKYPINTDTYNLKFSYNQILNVKKEIKNLFRENIAFSLEKIESEMNKKYNNIEKIFIYSALEELVNNRNEIILNKFNIKGYIIYRGEYYIFQPFDLQRDELPLIYRNNPMSIKPKSVDLEIIETNYKENNKVILDEQIINDDAIISKYFKNYNSLYNDHIKLKDYGSIIDYKYSIIGYLFDRFNTNEKIIFTKYILTNFLQKSKKINNIVDTIDIIHYLNNNNLLINYYSYIEPNKSKEKDELYVGFFINKNYFIIDNIEESKSIKEIDYKNIIFIPCTKDLINKINTNKKIINNINNKKEYNQIYSKLFISDNKKNNIFRIIDKSLEKKIYTKEKEESKRSKKTGIACSSLYKANFKELCTKLNIHDISSKKKAFICEDLELFFRIKNLNNNNIIWFEKQ